MALLLTVRFFTTAFCTGRTKMMCVRAGELSITSSGAYSEHQGVRHRIIYGSVVGIYYAMTDALCSMRAP